MHLLAHEIRRLGGQAFLTPWKRTYSRPRAEAYDPLNVPEAEIEDAKDVLVLTSEFSFIDLKGIKNAALAVWWLSFENSVPYHVHRLRNLRLRSAVRSQLMRKKILSGEYGQYLRAVRVRRKRAIHFANSYHAKHLMNTRFHLHADMLAAPAQVLASAHVVQKQARQVSYNPAKGGEKRVQALSSQRPDLVFVPISGLNPTEVTRTLAESSIYLDLGYFPGKDRLPREAALLGVPVVVANLGAARFDEDYRLASWQRIDVHSDAWERDTLNAIDRVLRNPSQARQDQRPFERQVASEASRFTDQVLEHFFELHSE